MNKPLNKKRFFIIYQLGLIIFSLLAAMINKYQLFGKAFVPTTLLTALTIYLVSTGIGIISIVMTEKARKYPYKKLTKRIIPALIVFYLASYLITTLAITITTFIWFLHLGRDLNEFWGHLFKYEINFANTQLMKWLMLFTIILFYVLWTKSVKKGQQLTEEKLKFQYNTLKAQVNPHFLFNSLNTLSELVYQDAKKADHYIKKLSTIYRYILENEKTDFVDLDKELNFIQHYFSLQSERDSEKIFLLINIPKPEQYRIVPVSLQLLIENALKHNSYSKASPLKIKIELENTYIVVSNNIQRKNVLEESTQMGLQNLKERVELSMNKLLVWQEKEGDFIVKIPVIEKT